jgi:hypothetical protein
LSRKPINKALLKHFESTTFLTVFFFPEKLVQCWGVGSLKPQYNRTGPAIKALQEENANLKR